MIPLRFHLAILPAVRAVGWVNDRLEVIAPIVGTLIAVWMVILAISHAR